MEEEPIYGAPHALHGYPENIQSQMPALRLLMQMGWTCLTAGEVNRLRGERLGSAILEPVLANHIRANARFAFKGANHPFTENAIQIAIQALKSFRATGASYPNEQAYDLLCLGTSVPQTIDGDTKSFTIDYIDWMHPARNTFHCTADFKVERVGFQKYETADIVLFVNGIPLAVIACKGASRPPDRQDVDEAIGRLADYQAREGIPQLFLFTQLLLALAGDKARYGTTGTPRQYWSAWRESGMAGDLRRVLDSVPDPVQIEKLRPAYRALYAQSRPATEQDRLLYALCRPDRLLELAYKFILFDAGAKKIARYQQYFTVKDILKRLLSAPENQPRPGGVVWHTQGSGKSLTMVMLAKTLALHPAIVNPKIILVTDRINLDEQLCGTFRACGLAPEQAATGKNLVELLNDRRMHVVTTLIHKFAAAMANRDLKPADRNTFVLVDEGHRCQYNALHARMRVALKGACFIAFTGTPLAKSAKKNTFARFGDLFRPAYTIARAVEDKAVVPLLYEARHIPQSVDKGTLDAWFRKSTRGLSPERKVDLKRKFSTEGQLNKALQKVRMIAWDVGMHYATTYRQTGLKGQLVAPDKETALRYKAFLDGDGLVVSELLISAPTAPEGEDRQGTPSEAQKQFWKAMLDRFGSEKNYNQQLISRFKHGDHMEIIIVVDKLLTGFDAPRNTVIYLARKLKEHTLLQAIARVNRLYPGKEYGVVLDYSGVIQELDQAIDFYDHLAEYDPADLEATIVPVQRRIEQLPRLHADLRELFAAVKGAEDSEVYETHLRDEALRQLFYERFGRFARTLALALSSTSFLMTAPDKNIRHYKADLKFFQNLRAAVGRRFQEKTDIAAYEPIIKKLIDNHLSAGEVQTLSEPIHLLDARQRDQMLADESRSTGARVDMIAAATRHIIEQEMTKDPIFYQRFSKLLNEVIIAYHAGRMHSLQTLNTLKDIAVKVTTHTDEAIPEALIGSDQARRYYGCVCEVTPAYGAIDPQPAARMALLIAERLSPYKIRDWRTNSDILNKMRLEIDDILFDVAREAGIDLALEDQDAIIERCIAVAIANED